MNIGDGVHVLKRDIFALLWRQLGGVPDLHLNGFDRVTDFLFDWLLDNGHEVKGLQLRCWLLGQGLDLKFQLVLRLLLLVEVLSGELGARQRVGLILDQRLLLLLEQRLRLLGRLHRDGLLLRLRGVLLLQLIELSLLVEVLILEPLLLVSYGFLDCLANRLNGGLGQNILLMVRFFNLLCTQVVQLLLKFKDRVLLFLSVV